MGGPLDGRGVSHGVVYREESFVAALMLQGGDDEVDCNAVWIEGSALSWGFVDKYFYQGMIRTFS